MANETTPNSVPPEGLGKLTGRAQMEAVARAIWRETYRHDTLMEWHEIKRGTLHHRRVMMAAAAAVLIAGQ